MRRYRSTPAPERPYTPPPATVESRAKEPASPAPAPRATPSLRHVAQLAQAPMAGRVEIQIERDEAGAMTKLLVRRGGDSKPVAVAIERNEEGQMTRLVVGKSPRS